MMTTKLLVLALFAPSLAWASCDPIGWVKVREKVISVYERYCEYQKNGVKRSIIVDGFCPFSPCPEEK
jgi:hypothetical protein